MLGGFAPLPLRLGGSEIEGLTAEQHARLSADLASAARGLPFAWVTYTSDGSGVTINAYNGMNGVGLGNAPTATRMATGDVELEWATFYGDEYDRPEPVNLQHAKASAHGATARRTRIVSVARNKVRVAVTNKSGGAAADGKVTVRVT